MIINAGVRALAVAGMAIALVGMAACSGGGGGSTGGGPAAAMLSGQVRGGNQPVVGAQVVALVAGSGAGNASEVACVVTDASGNFHFQVSGATCPSSGQPTSFTAASTAQVYLVAVGGNPGLTPSTTNNSALVLMAALGSFGSLPTSVSISELTTVAAVYPLAQMMSGSPSATLSTRLAQARNVTAKLPWVTNSMSLAQNLVNVATSKPGAGLPTCAGLSTDPTNCGAEEKLNTLADALAACVNTTGPSSSACLQLFCAATPGGAFSGSCTPAAIPTDTLQAALSIALNPGTVSSAGIFGLVGAAPPFAPALTTAPTDWTLALNFTGGGLNDANYLAIDGSGNVWVQNFNAAGLSEFGPNGAAISGASGIGSAGLSGPNDLAIDSSGNIWVADGGLGKVVKLNSSGTVLGSATVGGSLAVPFLIAIDGSGNAWTTISVTDSGGNLQFGGAVAKVSSDGTTVLSPVAGYPVATAGDWLTYGLAIDGNNNAWSSNAIDPGTLNELSSAGVQLSPNGTGTLGASGATVAGFAGGGMFGPLAVAVDASNNIWTANVDSASLAKLQNNGTPVSPNATATSNGGYEGGGGNSGGVEAIAIDGAGNAWATNLFNNSVIELTNSGTALSPNGTTTFTGGFLGGGLAAPLGIAIDSSGNVWVANSNGNNVTTTSSVTEFIGAAVPVKTPLIGIPQSP